MNKLYKFDTLPKEYQKELHNSFNHAVERKASFREAKEYWKTGDGEGGEVIFKIVDGDLQEVEQ